MSLLLGAVSDRLLPARSKPPHVVNSRVLLSAEPQTDPQPFWSKTTYLPWCKTQSNHKGTSQTWLVTFLYHLQPATRSKAPCSKPKHTVNSGWVPADCLLTFQAFYECVHICTRHPAPKLGSAVVLCCTHWNPLRHTSADSDYVESAGGPFNLGQCLSCFPPKTLARGACLSLWRAPPPHNPSLHASATPRPLGSSNRSENVFNDGRDVVFPPEPPALQIVADALSENGESNKWVARIVLIIQVFLMFKFDLNAVHNLQLLHTLFYCHCTLERDISVNNKCTVLLRAICFPSAYSAYRVCVCVCVWPVWVGTHACVKVC